MRIAFPSEDEVAAKDFIGFAALSRTLFPPLCSRIVLKTTLTAGGTPRQRRMERRPPADLLPFVARNHARQAKPDRALAPLSMLATLAPPAAKAAWRGARSGRKGSRSGAFGRLCRTKAQAGRPWIHAAFAARFVAAHAGAKEHATHRAISMILQQSEGKRAVDTTAKRMGRLRIETSRAFPAYAGNTRCSRWRASRRYRASRKRERKLPGPSASLAAASPASAMTAMAAAAPASGVPATAT